MFCLLYTFVVTNATIAVTERLLLDVISRAIVIIRLVQRQTVLHAIPALGVVRLMWRWRNLPSHSRLKESPRTACGVCWHGAKKQLLLRQFVHTEDARCWCCLARRHLLFNEAPIIRCETTNNLCNFSKIDRDAFARSLIDQISDDCTVGRVPLRDWIWAMAFLLQLVEAFRIDIAVRRRWLGGGGVRARRQRLRPQRQRGGRCGFPHKWFIASLTKAIDPFLEPIVVVEIRILALIVRCAVLL